YKYVEAATQNKYISKSVGLWHLFWVIGDMIAASIIVGWFIWVGLSSLLNYTIPFYDIILLSLIVPILYLIVGYFGIKFTAKTAIIVGLLQIILFIIFAFALIIKTPYNSLSYFNIGNSTNGLYGFFLAMVVGAFLAYGGYGSIVSLGEEAKFSKITLKKAIVTALIIMVAFDTFVVYSIVAAAGPNLSLADSSFAPGLYMTDKFFGLGAALVAFIFVVFAQIFSPVIFGNSGARTAFALARDGLLPKNLAKTHERYKSPHIATLWVFIILVIGIFATIIPMVLLLGESNGLFYSWAVWGTAITIFTLLYHIVVNNTLVILIKRMKSKINILSHIIGPSIASIIMIIAIYYSLAGLTGPMMAVYVLVPAWLIISIIVIYIRRNKTKVETVDELTAGE
ncbi:MAG: APC family permease, partial [Thermoplasmata archaeon]